MKRPKQIFKVSSRTVTIATILILIGILLFSGYTFKPQLESPVVTFKEEPLEKNTELQLLPGEQYTYAYFINDTQINITYRVYQGSNCTIIRLLENFNNPETCLDKWGLDKSGYNSTFEEPTILLFKPWMLALKENWRWNSSTYMSFDSMEERVANTYYRFMRTEDYHGRKSFVVEISSDTGPTEYEWIDAEKRVLLKTMGEGYVLEIVEGLPLE